VHFYKFHINDYAVQTRHLSNEEDLCYRRLLDFYYTEEAPIPLETDWVARRIQVDTDIVKTILNDFFQEGESGWINSRADAEIAEYHRVCEKNKSNGKRGGRPKTTHTKPKGNPEGTQLKASRTLSVISNQQSDTPIVPGGDEQTDLLEENLSLHRAKMLFRMRPSTQLDSSQIRSWKKNKGAVETTSEEDWVLLEWYFAQGGEVAEYRRRDLSTLLNNWNGEIQRAAEIAKKKGANFAKKERAADSVPTRWREILVDRYPQNFPDGITGGNFPNNFSLLPASVQAEIREHDGLVSQISEAIHATPSEEAA